MPSCHLACAPLTLADVPGVEGSRHPGLLVVTGATAIAALATRVVLALAAELLCEKQREDGSWSGVLPHSGATALGGMEEVFKEKAQQTATIRNSSLFEFLLLRARWRKNAFGAEGVTLASDCFAYS